MKRDIIVIGGYPGSGKSSVKRILADKLGYKTFSAGDFARGMAEEKDMTLEALNDLIVEKGENLDHLIDAEQKRIGAEGTKYVVDGHIAFHFIPDGFKVFLYIPIEVSAERIFNDRNAEVRIKSGDVMETYQEALERTQKRIENHKVRYKKHYNINVYDTSEFDIVIDTSNTTPEKVAEEIITAYNEWKTS